MFSSLRKRLAVTAAAVVIAGSGLAMSTAPEASAATTSYTYFLSNTSQAFKVSSGGGFTKVSATVSSLRRDGIKVTPQNYGFAKKTSTGQAYIISKCGSGIKPTKVSASDLKNIYASPSVPATPEIISSTCLN